MYEIEFTTTPQTQERKERLYHKRHNVRQNRIRRAISLAVFLAALITGLWAIGSWPLPIGSKPHSLSSFYLTIVVLCIAVCVAALLSFFNSIGQLFTHLPGTKLNYEGPFQRDSYRISFGDSGFFVWKNGAKTYYKYFDMHHIYKDKKGLLLAELDLYIPFETVKNGDRTFLLKKLYR